METSAEAWSTLAVMWHEGSGSSRSDFDTVLELRGGAILERTYQQGKVAGVAGHVQPGKLCWNDSWTRERSSVTHWPFLDTVLDYLQVQQGVPV